MSRPALAPVPVPVPVPVVAHTSTARAPIRVAALDDHPAVRAGLKTLLTLAPGLTYVGDASDEYALWPMLHRTRPDVLLLDLHHPGRDGLTLTAMVARRGDSPRVVLHTALPSDAITVAAALAGAAATVGKAAPTLELVAVLRDAAAHVGPAPVAADARRRVLTDLEPEDRALVAMRLEGTSVADIADVLGTSSPTVGRRLDKLLVRLTGSDAVGRLDDGPSSGADTPTPRTLPPRLARRSSALRAVPPRRPGVLPSSGS